MQKKVLAIHDISCVGRCSLTVALPIISAMGVETSVLPTAVLSTHTGDFTDYTFRDLTDDIMPVCAHWKKLGLKFDAIYSGYLGSIQQLSLMQRLFCDFREEQTLVLVDPVMGDNGRLYDNFCDEFVHGMKSLCAFADIIIPNITEACLLSNTPYKNDFGIEEIKDIIRKLSSLGPKKIVLTGVSIKAKELGCATWDSSSNKTNFCFREKIDGFFHGTGDVFASAMLGALMNGLELSDAAKIAVDFTTDCIVATKNNKSEPRFGVSFEPLLHSLYEKVVKSNNM